MAEVAVDRRRTVVFGNRRVLLAQVDIAADGDTFTLSNMFKRIEVAHASSQSAAVAAIGTTLSGGVITFQTGGAEPNALVTVIGF